MDRVPKVSDSRRVGREDISGGVGVDLGRRAPGVKVAGAKICFMVGVLVLVCRDGQVGAGR